MSGIFPYASDGGVQPPDADNAYVPSIPPLGTDALYFGNNCGVRLRPAVVNSILSEVLCVIDSAGLPYNPANLCNLRDAISAAIHAPRLMIWNVPGAAYSWTVPARISQAEVTVIGAGGAGGCSGDGSGGGVAGNAGGGGGAGGFAWRLVSGLVPATAIPVVVGAGGLGVTASYGQSGGPSQFGSFITAGGGAGGAPGTLTKGMAGIGGAASGGQLNIAGSYGGFSGPNTAVVSMSDVMAIYARGGTAAGGLSTVALGGSGAPGQGYGTAGGGATGGSLLAGGAGAPGIVIIRW